jgi:hypothetical protein
MPADLVAEVQQRQRGDYFEHVPMHLSQGSAHLLGRSGAGPTVMKVLPGVLIP